MARMARSGVIVCGLNGLGVETAKNLVLAGVKSVTLLDDAPCTYADLSSQFYLTPAHVEKALTRAAACVEQVKELNPAVAVSVASGPLAALDLAGYKAVVLCDHTLKEAAAVSAVLQGLVERPALIRADIRGVCGTVFCDFGPEHTVVDTDGEQPHSAIVSSISQESPALVTCVEDERVQFQDGMLVTFSEVQGMTGLNGQQFRVKNCKAYSFEVECDTRNMPEYVSGGLAVQVKESKTLRFKPLEQALEDPGEFLMFDFAKLSRPGELHWMFRALDEFQAVHARLPGPGSEEDAQEMFNIAKKLWSESSNKLVEELSEKLVKTFSKTCAGQLSPMAAIFGGITAQEALKACTGKFHPLFQWFYFDSMESLPDPLPDACDMQAESGNRYTGQINVMGKGLQDAMGKANIFLVGAGALGCEFLKNLALMGVSCGGGKLVVTDDDTIERSNLSRQFLFRPGDVGAAKSTCAVAAARAMNAEFNAAGLLNRVCIETENIFDGAFWKGTDTVFNALDNVNARLYVDAKCVYFAKPLLESGTLGTKCNTQVVMPHMTENYGASRDPPEKQAPMCTLHSFPHNIDHCLAWARSEFEGLLSKGPGEANNYLDSPEQFVDGLVNSHDSNSKEIAQQVVDTLVNTKCSTFDECIAWGRYKFEEYFYNKIAQLTFTFPKDATTSSGNLFWSPPKRFPEMIKFDPADAVHQAFAQAAAILVAQMYKVPVPEWAGDAGQVAAKAAVVEVAPFQPKSGVKINTDVNNNNAGADVDGSVLDTMKDTLAGAQFAPDFRLNVTEFEKDDDTNYHMAFICSLSNLRARNYSIEEVDFLQAKLIAGRIIPAIATTTAIATGLVCLEYYKMLQKDKPIEAYRNTFANLAIPIFASSEPLDCKKIKHKELEWTLWDRWVLSGANLLVSDLMKWFEDKGLDVYSVSCGATLLYSTIFPKHKERLGLTIKEVATKIGKVTEGTKYIDMVVACEDAEGEDVDVPLVTIDFA